MNDEKIAALDTSQLAMVLEKVPAGITVIDQEGHILYYNEYCSNFVDRKPEYIGKNIRFCHKKVESIFMREMHHEKNKQTTHLFTV